MCVRFGLLPAVALFAIASGAHARPATLEGKWRLNLKESEFLAGEAPPAELIMAITKDDGRVFRWTATVKLPGGESGETSFAGAIDGKPYPVAGRPGTTSKFSWTPDGALKQVSEAAGGIAVETCTFPANMKKMTCDARQTDMQGRVVSYYEAFDRL
ncbi:MAG: hypothetical protein JWM91_493 [Rhodospirillales bacterium]|nr:hypothetical protein [Rhodospirillales bacterium]